MVEVQLHLVRAVAGGFFASELNLLQKVLMTDLGHSASFFGIEVAVVDVERSVGDGGNREDGRSGPCGTGIGRDTSPVAVGALGELDVDLDLVVLESDEGKGETGVPAEPELERHIESLSRDLLGGFAVSDGGEAGEVRGVTHHVGVTHGATGGLGELIPHVDPGGPVLVDPLASDLELNRGDHDVTQPVQPPEAVHASRSGLGNHHVGNVDLEIGAMDEISVSGDGARHLLAPVGRAIEHLLNGLQGEVGMSTINDFEKCNLGITCTQSFRALSMPGRLYLKRTSVLRKPFSR